MTVTIDKREDGPACVAHVAGDIDLAVVPGIRDAIDDAVATGCTNVVLDLSEVHYADSSALGLLVWLDKRLQPYEGRLVLAGADRNVSRVLELSGLLGVAPTISESASVDEALQGLDMSPERTEPLWTRSIVVPAQVERMARVRSDVCELIEPLGLSGSALFDVKVALGEALANAVRHGSPGGIEDEIEVVIEAYQDRVAVCVRDRGHGFDGGSGDEDDVYASGGRGVMFMRALTDRVDFSRMEDGGTQVRLVRRLPARQTLPIDTAGR